MPLLKDAPPAHHVQASMVQSADPKQQSQGLDRATEKGSKTPATVHSSTVRSNSPFQGLLDVYGTIGEFNIDTHKETSQACFTPEMAC